MINIVIATRPATGSAIRFNGYKNVWEYSPQDYTQIMSDTNYYEISEEEAKSIYSELAPDFTLLDRIDDLRKGLTWGIDIDKSVKNYRDIDEQFIDYYRHFGKEPMIMELDEIGKMQLIDPGTKTPESMISNIQRIYPTWPITLNIITDLARFSILVDSFSQVPEVIKNLQSQEYLDFSGRIHNRSSGYRAVHLNFIIDDVKNEIQIHSKKNYKAKVAENINYKKWRDKNIGIIENELLSQKNNCDALYASYKQIITEKHIDFEKSKALFEASNNDGDFDKNVNEIQSVLDSLSK